MKQENKTQKKERNPTFYIMKQEKQNIEKRKKHIMLYILQI